MNPEAEPRYRQEARERKIRHYQLYYDKAHGLFFDPNNVAAPILFGGDYDGAYPLSAQEALQAWKEVYNGDDFRERTRWFLPFLEKLAQGKDFSLRELMPHCNSYSIRFEE